MDGELRARTQSFGVVLVQPHIAIGNIVPAATLEGCVAMAVPSVDTVQVVKPSILPSSAPGVRVTSTRTPSAPAGIDPPAPTVPRLVNRVPTNSAVHVHGAAVEQSFASMLAVNAPRTAPCVTVVATSV